MKKWSDAEKANWREEQLIRRSYQELVVPKIKELSDHYIVEQYGGLSYERDRYPLFFLMTKAPIEDRPWVLITGGVHGYETSGVMGALKFMKEEASRFEEDFNFVCFPCISPWGFETINRWNPLAIDPNRNFSKNSPAEECAAIYSKLTKLDKSFLAHFDLHETTDTDNTVFRPALEKRDGIKQEVWDIPDGFYLVGDSGRDETEFQKAILDSVKAVTHIAPSDQNGKIIGESVAQEGVINYDVKKLQLCAGLTNAKYVTTTEVYPDSPKVDDEECNSAQVAALRGGLNYLKTLRD